MDTILDQVQWAAMVVTVASAWWVGSLSKKKRTVGFYGYLISNVLWIVWGLHDHAYALIFLQVALALLNVRGAVKNDAKE